MRNSKLTIMEFGDIHLGHHNTPTEHICRNLIRLLPDTPAMGDVDLLILAGDVFDRQLSFGDLQIGEIQIFVYYLLKLCKKWDIVLRILEGTPSHDWRQSRIFETVNQVSGISCDFKYIQELSIEHIERFNIDVLYIPDEWRPTCDQTWIDVTKIMSHHGLDKVDFAIMHGCFPHQMPELLHKQLDMHDSHRYLSIVRELIFVGHIHHHSQYDRILAAGSTDRLCHGEEEPKGCLKVVCHENLTYDINFVENKHAKIYKSIDCTGLSGNDLIECLEYQIRQLPEGSAIRLKGNREDEAITAIKNFQLIFKEYELTTKVNKQTEVNAPLFVLEHKSSVVNLNSETLKTLLLERILTKHENQYHLCQNLIDEVLP